MSLCDSFTESVRLKVWIRSQFCILVTVKPGTCDTLTKSDVDGEEPLAFKVQVSGLGNAHMES